MGKIEFKPVTAEAKRFAKVNRVMEKYYNIADLDELRDMNLDVSWPGIPLKSRKKSFVRHKKIILALKPLFKKFVLEQNRVAKKDGYRNRIEYMNQRNGVPREKFELFLEKIDLVIKDLNQKFPKPPPEWADWYWSKYSTPDAPCLATKKKYTAPNDILKMIKKKAPEAAAIIPKIEVREQTGFNPSARYDKRKKKVIISAHTGHAKISICGVFNFVHEIAHAVVMLDYAKRGADISGKSSYWHEKEAYEVESKLVKKLFSKKIYDAWLASSLGGFVSTLFEYEIYNHPDRNFDRAFARANNRCYLKAHQRENPFYVLNSYFTFRSGCSAMTSVAITELLLEGKV